MQSTSADFSLESTLASHPYFEALDEPSVRQLAAASVQRAYPDGATIFLEGEPSSGLWIVEEGRIKIYKMSLEGREHILHMVGPGDSFNEISALDGGPNPASVETLTDALLWMVPTRAVRDVLKQDVEFALAILDGLSDRVRMLVGQIESLALYSVPARLARFLLKQAEDPSLDGPGITRAAIAAHLATTPETVSRVLRAFEEAGAIQFNRHRIEIVDTEMLRDFGME